jgi:hypothetical protein
MEVIEYADATPDDVVISAAAAEVTARLDQVYEREPSALEPGVRSALRRMLARDPW